MGLPRTEAPVDAPMADRDDALLGAELGGLCRVVRAVRRGAHATVYEAEHLRVPRRLAVKVLSPRASAHADKRARFEAEARFAARVRSPYCLEVFDFVETPDGRPALVTEFLEGESLDAFLERVPHPAPSIAVGIARDVLRALAAVHASGVVHRDVKPANVFIVAGPDGDARAKLIDFGVAVPVAHDAQGHDGRQPRVAGTPSYMAPEQARGDAAPHPATDVYGVGALLYRMLSGRAPFVGPDALAVLQRVRTERPPSLRVLAPGLSENLIRAVESALEPALELRPQSPQAFLALLKSFDVDDGAPAMELQDSAAAPATEQTVVLPGGAFERAQGRRRSMRRLRSRAVTAGVGIAAVAGALVATAATLGSLDAPWPGVLALAVAVCGGFAAVRMAKRVAARRGRLAPYTSMLTRGAFAVLMAVGSLWSLEAWVSALGAGDSLRGRVTSLGLVAAAGIGAWTLRRAVRATRRGGGESRPRSAPQH